MTAPLELSEHRIARFPAAALTEEQGLLLHERYGKYLDVRFPSLGTQRQWEITSQGWAGAFSVGGGTTLVVRPKVPVANLARMLVYAYDLELRTFDALVACRTIPELYDQLALLLARRTLALLRQGAHQSYEGTRERREAARGRLSVADSVRRPASTALTWVYSRRTADVLENRILLWTLDRILRSGLCSPPVRSTVHETYRQLLGGVSLEPVRASDCDRVRYDRLSERYRPAHALCRLFLETAGPVAERGDAITVPFLLHMPALFERFVAEWLRRSLPAHLSIQKQERSVVGDRSTVEFIIDLVLYERASGRPLCVLDTKYKDALAPAAGDVAQVGYYALLKGCLLAGLVYPVPVATEWSGRSGPVEIFRLTFDTSGDLEAGGQRLLGSLLGRVERAAGAVEPLS